MARRGSQQKAAALAASGGAALMPAPGPDMSQQKAVYYDRFGDTYLLPADAWSIEHYAKRRGNKLSLTPPSKPARHKPTEAVGTLDNWNWSMVKDPSAPLTPAPSGPTATYYTKDGVALENLPADPENMMRYLNEVGLSLTPPKEAS